MTRNNPQIWRLAEWLYNSFDQEDHLKYPWIKAEGYLKDRFYNKAAELLKKLSNNEFTGKDDHKD